MSRRRLLILSAVLASVAFTGCWAESADARRLEPSDHIGPEPFYIFDRLRIEWTELAPGVDQIFGDSLARRVYGTFPVPHAARRTRWSDVVVDEQGLTFPSGGRYYLHTTFGFFKVLILEPHPTIDEQILSIGAFVAGNTVHSRADDRKIRPRHDGSIFTPRALLRTFFASDQPVKLRCGDAARFLSFVLAARGHRVQLVSLRTEGQRGHVVMQVYLPLAGKFVMIDPDYGVLVRDRSGVPLSIQEIASLAHTRTSALKMENIGRKSWLRSKYNKVSPMAEFAWTPDKSKTEQTTTNARYAKLMRAYTFRYRIAVRNGDEWGPAETFRWDGQRVGQ